MKRTCSLTGAVRAGVFLGLLPAGAVPLARAQPPSAPATPVETNADAPPPPQLDWEKPILCLDDPKGQRIHAQCDEREKICLYHNGCLPGTAGKSCSELRRTKGCTMPPGGPLLGYEQWVDKGMRFVPAQAEAPPGWRRDGAGRVFQTHFDMNNRLWLGARWAPTYGPGDEGELGRVAFDTGLRTEFLSDDTRTRHRFHVLDGEVTLNPFTVDATLFRYDSSHESSHPLIRITTFWPPERHDLYLNVGWWNEVMGVQIRPRASEDETHLRFVATGLTTDLWHNSDLRNYVRLRLGAAFEDLYVDRDDIDHQLAMAPLAHLESDVVFDPVGQYRLSIASGYEAPLVWVDDEHALPEFRHRFINEISYEMILIAINDQPLTLRLATKGGYRNDLLEPRSGWEIESGGGLRFNFWAPGPDPAEAARIREVRGL